MASSALLRLLPTYGTHKPKQANTHTNKQTITIFEVLKNHLHLSTKSVRERKENTNKQPQELTWTRGHLSRNAILFLLF